MNNSLQKIIRNHANFTKEKYRRWAGYYDIGRYFYYPLHRKVARLVRLRQHAKVLDIATGTGEQAFAFARLHYDVTAVDVSEDMILRARKKIYDHLRLRFEAIDATSLPYSDNSFDASVISLGLHEMPYEIRKLVLSEMIRVTKPSGKLIFIDYPVRTLHPVNRFAYQIVRLYESPNFTDFVTRGLDAHLAESGLASYIRSSYFSLFIRACQNRK